MLGYLRDSGGRSIGSLFATSQMHRSRCQITNAFLLLKKTPPKKNRNEAKTDAGFSFSDRGLERLAVTDTRCTLHHAGPLNVAYGGETAVQLHRRRRWSRSEAPAKEGGGAGLKLRAYTPETPCKNTETIRALKHITSLNWRIPLPVGSRLFIYSWHAQLPSV